MALLKETPENIDELLKQAALTSDYKARLTALKELSKYDCPESQDAILRLALHDKVFKVKEVAFKAAKVLGIKKNGKDLKLGKKNIGYKLEDFTKAFLKIRAGKEINKFNVVIFKKAFAKSNPEMYDVMAFEKGAKFDSWVKTTYSCLPKK